MSESLWSPKMMQILGAAFIAHLQLGRDGEGRMFSSTASFQQHLFLTRQEKKEEEHTEVKGLISEKKEMLRRCHERSPDPPAQPHPCSMGILGAQGALPCLQKSHFGKSHCSKQSLLLPASAGLGAGGFWEVLTGESRESLWWEQASAQGLHLLAAASSSKANIWCHNEL